MINGQVSFVHIHVDKKPHASNYTHICTYSVKILLYNLRKEELSRFSSPSNTLCYTPQDYFKPTHVLENPLKYKDLCKYDFQVTNVWNSYSQISIGYYGFIVLLLSTFFSFFLFFLLEESVVVNKQHRKNFYADSDLNKKAIFSEFIRRIQFIENTFYKNRPEMIDGISIFKQCSKAFLSLFQQTIIRSICVTLFFIALL